jgi:hypothetical protein
MSNFSLQEFKSEVNRRGLAKPNRFEIAIHLLAKGAETKLISMFCESASLPQTTINVKQQRIYGPAYQKPFGVDYGGDGINMTFLLDREMKIKTFFDRWMDRIIHPEEYYAYYEDTYTASIYVDQLDEKDNVTYSIKLENAFPRSLSMLELNNTAQNQVHKLNVSFAYRRWSPMAVKSNEIKIDEITDPNSTNFNMQKNSGYDKQKFYEGQRQIPANITAKDFK